MPMMRAHGRETGTLLSTDEGASWQWLGGTSIPKDLRNFSEATLAQRKDGSLWMVIGWHRHKSLHEAPRLRQLRRSQMRSCEAE